MDFLAAGGFLQLFSDLDEQQISEPTVDAWLATDYAGAHGADISRECYYGCRTDLFTLQKDPACNYCDYYGQASSRLDNVYLGERLEATYSAVITDCNNNSSSPNYLASLGDTMQEPQYFDLLISPQETGEEEQEVFRALDIANWEEQFLDNYIELPELIDFLPEKTPLCTETCERVLHESSVQLQLHRMDTATDMATDTADKVPQTEIASKTTTTTTTTIDTMVTTGYACTFGSCQKIYAKPAHLKAHLRRHLGEKPYVCTWPDCAWKFSRSDELARHRRSHSGVKPYSCDYCMKCFARSDHLTKHRKVHERRLLAASRAGTHFDGEELPLSVLNVRPGRKRKNQIC